MIKNIDLTGYLSDLGIESTNKQREKLIEYINLLYAENKIFNIVGTKNLDDIMVRHIFDCLSIFQYFNKQNKKPGVCMNIIDIGTGGGLPGMLLGIFLTNAIITLLDCKEKIIKFLKKVKTELSLSNIEILQGRAEILAHKKDLRENFDLVVSRALANSRILSELTLPFCRVGGEVIMYKSKNVYNEIEPASKTIELLGAEIKEIFEVSVKGLNECRVLLVLKKEKNTIYKYPRKYAKILKISVN